MNAETPVTVQADSFLTLHYRVTTGDGTEILNTFEMKPATLQMGSGQLAENLERCLLGLPAGKEVHSFDLPPDTGFGEHNPRLVERIALSAMPAGVELKENALVEFSDSEKGDFAGFIRELTDRYALVDFNHPLAGKQVRFEVQIIGIL
ncbi:FKBP-type peptidyl-prolyl cis-trans isomerase [Azospira inquinata]|uniref:Peptidyl-prolyl cis-trans isomerase n=1 Tax=Azospira inquinata TaxID=2785627 RepID=A0A975SNI1_9RHOO|nr:FKBP-type peptidyl-prolyl cis-trans isomerase [Azospira inquinata]QWT45067.1 FKBP-type peptidyl-prolyl cis-trans isomerase [Azospira inquinata]QWT49600.1 FKBP-type peptidyl-prolyl cis-trans isomerase [Azospira inquinata]